MSSISRQRNGLRPCRSLGAPVLGAVFSPSISRQDACFCYSPRPFPSYKLPRKRFSPSAQPCRSREFGRRSPYHPISRPSSSRIRQLSILALSPKKEVFSDFRDLRRLCHIHHKGPARSPAFADPGVRMFKHADRHPQCTEQVPFRRIHPLSRLSAAAGGPAARQTIGPLQTARFWLSNFRLGCGVTTPQHYPE